ncbi:MAG: AAA family ATPase, partial [Planctomycetia bacterium]
MDQKLARLVQQVVKDDDAKTIAVSLSFASLVAELASPQRPTGEVLELARHPSPSVRAAVLSACALRPEAESRECLLGGALDPHALVRVHLCSLMKLHDLEALVPVRTLLYDSDASVRQAATHCTHRREALRDELEALLDHDPVSNVRAAAALALATLGFGKKDDLDPIFRLVGALRREREMPGIVAVFFAIEQLLRLHMPDPDGLDLQSGTRELDYSVGLAHYANLETYHQEFLPRCARFFRHSETSAPEQLEVSDSAPPDPDPEPESEPVPAAAPPPVRPVPPDMGHDLRVDLEAGKLARAFEVESVLAALEARLASSSSSRSSLLVGEPGVGKTAIVGELARRLDARGWVILRMQPSDFVVETKYLGEWQTRLAELVKWASSSPRILLYIPDIHELVDAGRATDDVQNVASALAPHVANGRVAVLGETTPERLRASSRPLGALRGALLDIDVPVADRARTLAIVRAVARDAGRAVPESWLERACELADLHLGHTAAPGRAVGLVRGALAACPEREPSPRDLLQAVAASTGLPVDFLDDDRPLDLSSVRRFLESRVMGQPEAVDALLDLVALVKAGLCDPLRPLGVYLFVGPTGVGKTELARALAELIFGDPARMLRFDMSEYATWEALERLTGSGRAPGTLTSFVRERPFSVLLLDEIEKAHQSVFDACLQMFDAGRLTDAGGRTTNLRGTIIILTSNLGSAVPTEARLGFGGSVPPPPDATMVLSQLRAFFRPEFLNRLDKIVQFQPLSRDTAERIARRELAAVFERSGVPRRALAIDVDPALVALLVEQGWSPAFGARPLKRTVERLVLLPLARAVAQGEVPTGSLVSLRRRGDGCALEIVGPEAASDGPVEAAPRRLEREERALRERAGRLAAEGDDLVDAAEAWRERRSALFEASGEPGFWDDRVAALRRLDELHKIDSLLESLEHFQHAARGFAEWALRAQESRERARTLDRLVELEEEAARLRFLLDTMDPRELGDAVLVLQLVRPRESALGAVERLAQMYLGWTERHRYQVEVLDDRCGLPAESAALVVSGPGAWALLAAESGLHQLSRVGDERGREERELVRVEVLPLFGLVEPRRSEVVVETRGDPAARGRRVDQPRLLVSLLHRQRLVRVDGRGAGAQDEQVERLLPLLAAR